MRGRGDRRPRGKAMFWYNADESLEPGGPEGGWPMETEPLERVVVAAIIENVSELL